MGTNKLVLHFVEIFARRMGKRVDHVPKKTLEAFTAYSWPGESTLHDGIVKLRSFLRIASDR